jgi:hypothetical protein
LTIFATLGTEFAGITIIHKGVGIDVGDNHNVAAFATITTIGATHGDKLFAAKASDAIATVAGMYRNDGFIYKAHDLLLA